jgi:hypothetical protein
MLLQAVLADLTDQVTAAHILPGTPLVFDPAFDQEDTALLVRCGFRVLDSAGAEQARSCSVSSALCPCLSLLVMQRWQAHAAPLGEHTLFFMPHCEQFLYEAVLAASLRGSGLAHAAILGNSFAEYEERAALLRSASDPDASCLSRLQPYIQGAPRTLLATSSVPL